MSARAAKTAMVATLLLLSIALGLKMLRYTAPVVRMDATFETRLTDFLADLSWQRQSDDPETKNSAVQIITFKKKSCAAPLRVSIVGTTSGLESYLRQTFGNDLAFVQHGKVLHRPSLLRFEIFKTWLGLKAAMFGGKTEHRPILAVIPAPKPQSGDCDGPSISQWEGF